MTDGECEVMPPEHQEHPHPDIVQPVEVRFNAIAAAKAGLNPAR